jgi:hypothetical protein
MQLPEQLMQLQFPLLHGSSHGPSTLQLPINIFLQMRDNPDFHILLSSFCSLESHSHVLHPSEHFLEVVFDAHHIVLEHREIVAELPALALALHDTREAVLLDLRGGHLMLHLFLFVVILFLVLLLLVVQVHAVFEAAL